MLVALLLGLFACQDPAPQPPAPVPAPAPVQAPAEPWDDATAKAAVEAFGKAMKGAPSMNDKHKALEGLAKGTNKLLLKPLAQVVETDKSVVIRKRAAELLAQQPVADANPVIRKLLRNPKVAVHAAVLAELVRGLSRCGYQSAQWADIADLFERSYAADRVPLQEALLTLVETHKEKLAIPLLLRNLDEPVPANPDAADNPPAEYWEARWKAWAVWRGKVKDTLFAITGQRFSTAEEAKAWLKQNPLK